MRFFSSSLISLTFACIFFFIVCLRIVNLPFFLVFPHICVNPKKCKRFWFSFLTLLSVFCGKAPEFNESRLSQDAIPIQTLGVFL